MKIRYAIIGGGAVAIVGLAAGLAGVGISNLDNDNKLNLKRQELNYKLGIMPPPESSIIISPSSPARPSPGYEN